jgi:DNA-binding NtrC family response regulator
MAEPIRILLLEDVARDAELLIHEFKRAGLDAQTIRVDAEDEFRRQLAAFQPDLVLSDFSMPGLSGMAALAISLELRPDIPFIFISGTIGENVAVEAMKAGAADYVMKNNLAAGSRDPARASRKRGTAGPQGSRAEARRERGTLPADQ